MLKWHTVKAHLYQWTSVVAVVAEELAVSSKIWAIVSELVGNREPVVPSGDFVFSLFEEEGLAKINWLLFSLDLDHKADAGKGIWRK